FRFCFMLCCLCCRCSSGSRLMFFFTASATPELYTLSLHDALPISARLCPWRPGHRRDAAACQRRVAHQRRPGRHGRTCPAVAGGDRKSTRLNSSHGSISYAVFCLKKKKTKIKKTLKTSKTQHHRHK